VESVDATKRMSSQEPEITDYLRDNKLSIFKMMKERRDKTQNEIAGYHEKRIGRFANN